MAWILLFMKFKYSVYNRYIPALDFENNDLAHSHWLILIISEEEQITSMKCRLHAATVLRISANQYIYQALLILFYMDVLFATLLNYPNIIHNIIFAVIKLSDIIFQFVWFNTIRFFAYGFIKFKVYHKRNRHSWSSKSYYPKWFKGNTSNTWMCFAKQWIALRTVIIIP